MEVATGLRRTSAAWLALGLVPLACGDSGTSSPVPPGPDAAVADAAEPDAESPIDSGSTGTPDAAKTYPIALTAWPGSTTVTTVTGSKALGANVSDLVYEPAATGAATLWAIQNEPSKLYRLTWNGSIYEPVVGDGWTTGKLLHYPDGTGSPDSEGLTRTELSLPEVYVVAERDNDNKTVSRQSILRFELTGTRAVINASQEWNVTSDLPAAGTNGGLEGIAWIPDAHLVARGFIDESTQAPYVPESYPNHGNGVFLVSFDDDGMVYGYVLDHAGGTFRRVATFKSGLAGAMGLELDRDTGLLWVLCDDACNSKMSILEIETDVASSSYGKFVLRATVPAPKGIAGMNNEGLSIAPESECAGNRKPFFWSNDDEANGYAIRQGSVTCGRPF